MNDVEYRIMFEVENDHWWYVGLHDLTLRALRSLRQGQPGVLRVLDAGCGTGRLLELLAAEPPERFRAEGLEYAGTALPFLRRRGLRGLTQGSIDALPYADESFDAVVSHDVLCILDRRRILRALREFRRVLAPGGTLLMNLPAYDWLKSRHDRAVATRTRFEAGSIRGLLTESGFLSPRIGYRNTILFPAVAAVRLLQKAADRGKPADLAQESDLSMPPRAINAALGWPLRLENRWIDRGGRLPFGLSVWIQAPASGRPPGAES